MPKLCKLIRGFMRKLTFAETTNVTACPPIGEKVCIMQTLNSEIRYSSFNCVNAAKSQVLCLYELSLLISSDITLPHYFAFWSSNIPEKVGESY